MSFAIESGLLPAQIAALEEQIQRILPAGYKRFLSQYNGFYVAALLLQCALRSSG